MENFFEDLIIKHLTEKYEYFIIKSLLDSRNNEGYQEFTLIGIKSEKKYPLAIGDSIKFEFPVSMDISDEGVRVWPEKGGLMNWRKIDSSIIMITLAPTPKDNIDDLDPLAQLKAMIERDY